MVKLDDVSFFYHGGEPLFESVSFTIGENQKIALVGPNGAGKTTLLKIIRGEEEASLGRVKIIGTVSHVPQEVKYDPDLEIAESIRAYLDLSGIHEDHEIKRILSGLELASIELERSPDKLSGGQKTRLALARALLAEPDILLLDEPTNFMDVRGKKWVMNFLANYEKTIVIISHDISLMDHYIDKVFALNPAIRTLDVYKGNYSSYLDQKKERERVMKKHIEIETKRVKRLEKSLTKVARYSSAKGVRVKTRLRHKYEGMKANLPEMPPEAKRISLLLPAPSRVGELPIKIIGISKSYGENKVLDDIDLTVYRGEKVALIGENGAGKSTLLKIMVGDLAADAGEVLKDPEIKLGYYSQELELLDRDKTVLNFFQETTSLPERRVRALLGGFLFDKRKVNRKIAVLSGGEKTRLAIALLVFQDFNLLVLDEPTTYLDVMSQRVILEALKAYEGAVLIVSHTKQFIRELAPARALLLPEGKVKYWDDGLLDRVGEM